MNLDELEALAMQLSSDERGELAARLLLSLEDAPLSSHHPGWLEELDRRAEDLRSGRVQGLPGDETFKDAFTSLQDDWSTK